MTEPEDVGGTEFTAVAVPVAWVAVDELPVLAANQFITQADPDHIYLSAGMAMPPVVLAETVEERQAAIQQITFVPVRPIARLALTRKRAEELITVLQRGIENYDQQQGG